MRTEHDIPAVVTSLNVNGLAVARVLGRHRVPVIGIHGNKTDPETRCRYLDEVWLQSDSLVELLLHQGKLFQDPPVLFPITDEAVAAVATHLEDLRRYYRVPMARAGTVLQLMDKRGFDEVAREYGMPVPDTRTVADLGQLEAILPELKFPCILKPQVKTAGFAADGGHKAYLVEDAEALRSTYASAFRAAPRAVIQQYVPGGDGEVFFCLQTCGVDHSALASFTGRKIRQWRPHCGGTASCEPVERPNLAALTARFFERAEMVGPCSMEFKRDPRDDTFYMIEPTVCRTDWQNGVADANGVPIAYIAYCAASVQPLPRITRPRLARRWVQFGADRMAASYYRERGELGLFRWLWSIRPMVRGAYFAIDDLGPFLAIFKKVIRRGFRRLRGSR